MTNNHGQSDAERYDRLRHSARDLIEHGVPPRSRGGTLSADSLRLLYDQTTKPESSAEAFKLLHELQTYQVELDLMYEQIQANEHEIIEELAHYRALYEQAPAAYLIVANDGEIIEGNNAAGLLFGRSTTDLPGRSLSALFARGQKEKVNSLIGANPAEQFAANATFELADHRRLTISARPAAAGDSVLMILTETEAGAAKS